MLRPSHRRLARQVERKGEEHQAAHARHGSRVWACEVMRPPNERPPGRTAGDPRRAGALRRWLRAPLPAPGPRRRGACRPFPYRETGIAGWRCRAAPAHPQSPPSPCASCRSPHRVPARGRPTVTPAPARFQTRRRSRRPRSSRRCVHGGKVSGFTSRCGLQRGLQGKLTR